MANEKEESFFEFKISSKELEKRVSERLDKEIDELIKIHNVSTLLKTSISKVFESSFTSLKVPRIQQLIEDSIENTIRNSIYKSLEKTEIKETIEKAIEDVFNNPDFIKEIAKAKTLEITNKK